MSTDYTPKWQFVSAWSEGDHIGALTADGLVVSFPVGSPEHDRLTAQGIALGTEPESRQLLRARVRRDVLLSETDWTQLPDLPESKRAAFAAYRQALRDITQQDGSPNDWVWPEYPAT